MGLDAVWDVRDEAKPTLSPGKREGGRGTSTEFTMEPKGLAVYFAYVSSLTYMYELVRNQYYSVNGQ